MSDSYNHEQDNVLTEQFDWTVILGFEASRDLVSTCFPYITNRPHPNPSPREEGLAEIWVPSTVGKALGRGI